MFGYDDYISSCIMEYLGPSDLLNTARCNKKLYGLLDTRLVVRTVMYTGGNTMRSMTTLYPLMKKRAIQSMTPFRLLSSCTGCKCEYCGDKTVYTGSPGRTLFVRGSFGTKICWDCLRNETRRRTLTSPHTPIVTSATKRIFKYDIRRERDGGHINPYYRRHRETLLQIFSHSRVLAYPYGNRPLDRINGELVPVEFEHMAQDPVHSKDAYEIMWTEPHIDCFGNRTGPIVGAIHIPDLVMYLEMEGNFGIDYFIDNHIPSTSSKQSYDAFVESYEEVEEKAQEMAKERRLNAIANANVTRFKLIDNAMHGIHLILERMSISNIKIWTAEISTEPKPDCYWITQCNIMTRTLLLYREIPYCRGKWVLTYDTGCEMLNYRIHQILGDYLTKPSIMSMSQARKFAKLLYVQCREILQMECVPGVFTNTTNSELMTGFSRRYRRCYHCNAQKFADWQDRSENRNL